ncbi:hypothetical protein [Fulvivirga sedimenti]|uniref:Uncharacterized protein n=1 Tax=Fulvivirga sedimenti TaxID=2879465 RepID=A0A9X1KV46_9BACT|nr:hypothetical protein [Fulvivirga sedimenti]MCA6074313.1 hypothetical protein [Fulvivirga sedimenti]
MTSAGNKLPPKINEYIHRHFREDFLFKVQSVRRIGEHVRYSIDVAKDEHIYHLKFDEKGWLLKKEVEEAFPADDYDDPHAGDSAQDYIFR